MVIDDGEAPVIRVDNLRMRYGQTDVLQDVSFEVRRGEVVALLGPNGAGKTTTIEILEGFRAPSGGQVSVLGVDPLAGGEDWRARVGVVLQSWRDHGRWRVHELLDQLGSYYEPYGTSARPRPYPTAELLERVGLAERARQPIKTLSGGQRRRLDVAVGIVGRPELLFLDEPTAGFDPVARRDFHDLVHRLADLEDTTILLTTHDLAEAEKLADRILILDAGRIVADGTAERLARDVAGATEVRWTQGGQRQLHSTADGTAFVRDLFAQYGTDITDLEVRRTTLEDTYLVMVARSATPPDAAPARLEAAR
ncbi:ABC transporter ATP-binding protein [Georgenia faecalis]|uniref:ABC transporter ATP-binding protein n=1 Tax=Georgenia faecalis TaxID=2483799 RepID=UPI000FD7C2CC|nr:ABC transporter ATP-binding protein [Georgenia faecalis]